MKEIDIKKRINKLKQAFEFAEEGIVNLSQLQRVRILQEVTTLEKLIKQEKNYAIRKRA